MARDSWVATIEREYHNIELNGKTAVMPKSSLHAGWSDKHQNGMEPRENIYYTPTEVYTYVTQDFVLNSSNHLQKVPIIF